MAPLILLCLERSTHLYVYFLLISLAIPTNITFWKCFCILFINFLVIALATALCVFLCGWIKIAFWSIKIQHSWKEHLDPSCLICVQRIIMKAQSDQKRTANDTHLYNYCVYACVCGGGTLPSDIWYVRAMSCTKPSSSETNTPVPRVLT